MTRAIIDSRRYRQVLTASRAGSGSERWRSATALRTGTGSLWQPLPTARGHRPECRSSTRPRGRPWGTQDSAAAAEEVAERDAEGGEQAADADAEQQSLDGGADAGRRGGPAAGEDPRRLVPLDLARRGGRRAPAGPGRGCRRDRDHR